MINQRSTVLVTQVINNSIIIIVIIIRVSIKAICFIIFYTDKNRAKREVVYIASALLGAPDTKTLI